MRISFKYKFILSFAIIEISFISLIVFFNFLSLNNLSKSLIDEKVQAATALFSELLKTPLIVYDTATIDNAVESFLRIKNVVAVKITDNQNRVISHLHSDGYEYKDIFTKGSEAKSGERTFRQNTQIILFDGEVLGSVRIVFEITQSLETIQENKNLTFTLVFLEIFLSVIVAYIIGYRLTKSLTLLTLSAEQIAHNDEVIFPNVGSSGDEISVLSKALHIMQQKIAHRNTNLNNLVKKVQDSSDEFLKERNFYTALLNHAGSIILVMNAKGEIVLSNKIIEKLTGYSQDELQGKFPWDIFIPIELREKVKKVFFSLVAGDFPSSYENAWIIKDGSHKSFAWSNSCLTNEGGDIEYVITVGIDMSEKNKKDQTIRALLNSPQDSIVLISTDETIIEINEIAANILGAAPNLLKGKKLSDYVSKENLHIKRENFNKLISTKEPVVFEEKQRGNIYKRHLYPILDTNGDVIQISIFSHNVTVQREAQKELQKYIELVDENVIISHADLEGVTTSVSKAFCKISGYDAQELIGTKFNILRDPKTPASVYEDLWKTIQSGKVWHGEIRNIAKDGSFYWIETSIYPDYNDDNEIIGYNAIRQDITNEKLIEELSITDALTKLYNRRYFDDIFEREINKARRSKKIFCLLSLDVDNFKLYNDTYGHQMGDNVLFAIASVLKQNMKRPCDIAFRIGGEEFSAIYVVENEKDVYEFAEKLRRGIEEEKIEHKHNSASPYVTASFGAIYVDFEKNQNITSEKTTLYKMADELLYKAKREGRNIVLAQEFSINI